MTIMWMGLRIGLKNWQLYWKFCRLRRDAMLSAGGTRIFTRLRRGCTTRMGDLGYNRLMATFDIINPATSAVLDRAPDATVEDAKQAIENRSRRSHRGKRRPRSSDRRFFASGTS